MDMHELTRELLNRNDSKIVMLVADGLGGLPLEPGGKTELETANTPHLDELARRGVSGGSIPVKPGISPGSGPGHLGLFGYDPLQYRIGRGALEATGIGFELGPNDVAGGYDIYGPRVPAVVASPYSKPNSVTNVVHDHTSVLATVEAKWNLPRLTYRDANAKSVVDFLDLEHAALLEPPVLAEPPAPVAAVTTP